jgi:hypothetical protein
MIRNEPATVSTKHRIYTTESQRARIGVGIDSDEPLGVLVHVVDRAPEWGTHGAYAAFETTYGRDGQLRVPQSAVERLGLSVGDSVRLTVAPRREVLGTPPRTSVEVDDSPVTPTDSTSNTDMYTDMDSDWAEDSHVADASGTFEK